jgi:hypothetical protein
MIEISPQGSPSALPDIPEGQYGGSQPTPTSTSSEIVAAAQTMYIQHSEETTSRSHVLLFVESKGCRPDRAYLNGMLLSSAIPGQSLPNWSDGMHLLDI